ncbi:MAG: hypothetical protein IJR02_00300 [Bacteroidaceae bacterium]|nr:hypothetical protein [Bacteroidaceae bacterium]MBQ7460749.1 hypothetical protein [Bacteroidaceae bacterium]
MNKISLAIIAASFSLTVFAQNGINSPYSRYGFGIQSERAMGFNKGMGGVAQGFRNGQQINIANPASYSEVDSLTALFDLGLSLQNGNYKMPNVQQNIRNTSFDYFAFQFRAAKHVGMTLGLMPITNIKYNFASSSENLEGTENITSSYSFNGDGGLREVFLGIGWKTFSPISIGINTGYIWGDYTHNMSMTFSESSAFNMRRTYSADIRTYNLQGGIQYIQPLNKADKLVIGATYTFGHNINKEAYRNTATLNSSTIETQTIDTIKNAFQLPHAVSAGITYYHSNRLRVGADYEIQKWGKCKFPNQQTSLSSTSSGSSEAYTATSGQLYDRTKISAGLDWTPNPNPVRRNYFKRCTYKIGGYFAKTYANADVTGTITQKPYELGVSAGISMPIYNRWIWHNSPRINISAQWVHTNIPYLNTTTLQKNTLTENYLKLCIGVTFSERWFYKYKVQ